MLASSFLFPFLHSPYLTSTQSFLAFLSPVCVHTYRAQVVRSIAKAFLPWSLFRERKEGEVVRFDAVQ